MESRDKIEPDSWGLLHYFFLTVILLQGGQKGIGGLWAERWYDVLDILIDHSLCDAENTFKGKGDKNREQVRGTAIYPFLPDCWVKDGSPMESLPNWQVVFGLWTQLFFCKYSNYTLLSVTKRKTNTCLLKI